MPTISDGTTTIEPLLILNDDRERADRNVLLQPIDAPSPYVSLVESETPTQSLRALFATEADATEALDLVSSGRVLTVTTDARNFSCVKNAPARIARASENRARWILEVGVREL